MLILATAGQRIALQPSDERGSLARPGESHLDPHGECGKREPQPYRPRKRNLELESTHARTNTPPQKREQEVDKGRIVPLRAIMVHRGGKDEKMVNWATKKPWIYLLGRHIYGELEVDKLEMPVRRNEEI